MITRPERKRKGEKEREREKERKKDMRFFPRLAKFFTDSLPHTRRAAFGMQPR